MKKINIYFIIFIITAVSVNLFAQQEFSIGSPYTINGLGDPQYYISNRTDGMSITGISFTGDFINSMNPAANYKLSYTLFSLGFKYSFLKSSDGNKNAETSDGNITGFNFGFPIQKNLGWVLNAGFNPVYQINYKIINNGITNGIPVKQTYAGSGGLSRLNAGMSFEGLKNFSIGVEYNYEFGNVKKLATLDFNNSQYSNSYRKTEENLYGSFVKFGLLVNLGRIFKELKAEELTLGFLYQTKLNLSSDLDNIYGTSLGYDTTSYSGAQIEIPQLLGAGIMNRFGKRFIVSADALFQDWSKYKVGNNIQPNLQNSFRAGIGLEITPSSSKYEELGFWDNKYYRLGFFYEKTKYFINGESINGLGASLGIGIPITRFTSIDIALSYITRGKTGNGLLKEDMLRITAGINFGELWFLRPKDEDK
ncbi:MAG: hypothetical protein JW917_06670 [Ignavibacteria bacterium]|nr:hypothetical protein [Ignavibacteria bacterium]